MNQKDRDNSFFEKIRAKLKNLNGAKYWRGLEELAETEDFKKYLAEEYPNGAADFSNPVSRREFLKLMGASLMMMGLAGCKPPPLEKIVPYRKMPEEIIPGKPLFFATAMTWNGYSAGLLVESHMGRPVKIEGNPGHPDSLGAASAIHQASLLGLYDPDRSKVVLKRGRISTWDTFLAGMDTALMEQSAKEGAGLRLLTESVVSPALAFQIRELLKKYPKAQWHQWEALPNDKARQAQKIAFGEYVDSIYRIDEADVILSLGSNFLTDLPGSLRYARQFAARRKPEAANSMNRLYHAGAAPSVTASVADHRLVLNSEKLTLLAAELASRLGIRSPGRPAATLSAEESKWLSAVFKDLQSHPGKSLIIAGTGQPPAVQALVHAMNEALGNRGSTVSYIDPVEAMPSDRMESLRSLNTALNRGEVDLLLICGGNPVYSAPADLNFAANLKKAKESVHLGLYEDETSAYCSWHIPQAHYLEVFSDGRASDGTITLMQPLIAPLYNGKSDHEILSVLNGNSGKPAYDIIKDFWKGKLTGSDFESAWRRAIHDGLVPGTSLPAKNVAAKTSLTDARFPDFALSGKSNAFELHFQPDPSLWDGSFANNGWLQELPKPITKLTWDNPAWISLDTAEKFGLANGDEIEISISGRSVRVPVWIVPGHEDSVISLFTGSGRTLNAKIARGQGFDVYPLRGTDQLWTAYGATIKKTGKKHSLAATQHHHTMEDRHLIRSAPLAEFRKHPDFAQKLDHGPLQSLYPEFKYEGYAWGMSVNLNACIGCNACIIACQSENNTPVVGKKEVEMGREMHWIRIDQYHEGSLENPEFHHQPVMCMHCEKAPCEPVCPVGATVHSSEGLNEMVYNRCVGTRYCSNNCPYKVRRFNFLQYQDWNTESFKLMRNPDVTVRARGVMEKCTFCVQRINSARIEAKKENRDIRDGEVVTACQAACPTQAIIFGDINNAGAQVTELKKSPRNYGLLTELNTQPRLTYLAKVTNPSPELAPPAKKVKHHG